MVWPICRPAERVGRGRGRSAWARTESARDHGIFVRPSFGGTFSHTSLIIPSERVISSHSLKKQNPISPPHRKPYPLAVGVISAASTLWIPVPEDVTLSPRKGSRPDRHVGLIRHIGAVDIHVRVIARLELVHEFRGDFRHPRPTVFIVNGLVRFHRPAHFGRR